MGACGGIVGYLRGGVIDSCYNVAQIRGESSTVSGGNTNVGGILGNMVSIQNGATIRNCYNRGTIYGYGHAVGGIAGGQADASTVNLIIENCYSIGTLYGKSPIGVIIGADKNVSLINCCTANPPSGIGWNGNASSTTTGCKVFSEEGLKLSVSALGTEFKKDDKNINNGFPILKWQ